jgi:DNA/RNA-binding domain of Phe-tRNA-synthetase-like protein
MHDNECLVRWRLYPSRFVVTSIGNKNEIHVCQFSGCDTPGRLQGYDMSTTPTDGPVTAGRFSDFSVTIEEGVRELGHNGVHFVMTSLTNAAGDDEFDELLGHVLDDLDDATADGYDLRGDPVLHGYRTLHAAVGRSNRDHVASAENLQRLVKMNGTIPRVNLLVDLHNLVSLKTRLAITAHDLGRVRGNVRLVLTTGRERFVPLSAAGPKPVHPGEYGYVDEAGEMICRMETRQAASTRPDLLTSDCFYIVQGNAATPVSYLRQAASDLVALTTYFCGGVERQLEPAT